MFDKRHPDLATRAYLGIGSNIGERELNVLKAVRLLSEDGIGEKIRTSSLYETAPVACAPMRNFINAVVVLQSLLCPRDLLKRVKVLEKRLGRRAEHNEPRKLDIDILLYGDSVIEDADLIVPHARYRDRLFVLVPMAEITPEFRCPVTQRSIHDLIGSVRDKQEIARVSTRRIG